MSGFGRSSNRERLVQTNTMPAAFSAGIMILCGYFAFALPAQTDTLVGMVNTWFVYALRIGGVGMVAAAVVCAVGHPAGLLIDAVVSFLAGVILALTGLVMLIKVGVGMDALWLMIGLALITYAYNHARDYLALQPDMSGLEPEADVDADLLANMSKQQGNATRRTARKPADQAVEDEFDDDEPFTSKPLVNMEEKVKAPTAKRYSSRHGDDYDRPISLADLGDSDAGPSYTDDPSPKPNDRQHSDGKRDDDGGFLADLGNDDD